MTTTNPYKGIHGGDPRLRFTAKKTKPAKQKVTFVCTECSKSVTEYPKGGKTAGICTPCATAKNLAHQRALEKAKKDASEKRRSEDYRTKMATPLRSDEELAILLESYKDHPKEACEFCNKVYFVDTLWPSFFNDPHDRINAIKSVIYREDPFDSEINGNDTLHWMCADCYQASAHEI